VLPICQRPAGVALMVAICCLVRVAGCFSPAAGAKHRVE
jgi:hypothetical protein